MKIWTIDMDVNHYCPLKAENWSLEDMRNCDGKSLQDNWMTRNLVKVELGKNTIIGDLASFETYLLFLSNHAKGILENKINNHGEFLPLLYEDQPWWMLNVTTVLNCIDYTHAVFKKYPNSDKIMRFIKYSFLPKKIPNSCIFRIAEKPLSGLFVTNDIKELIENAELKGFIFNLVWDEDESNVNNEDTVKKEPTHIPYAHVIDLHEDDLYEISERSQAAKDLLSIESCTNTNIVEKINQYFLVQNQISQEDILNMSCLWIECVVKEYNWSLKILKRNQEPSWIYLISPKKYYCIAVIPYFVRMAKLRKEKNEFPTIALIFNMMKEIDNIIPKTLYEAFG